MRGGLRFYIWIRAKRKFAFGIVAFIGACLIVYATSSTWNERVSTISDFQKENSALTRVLVWKWTLGFAASHPFGGGFQSYLVNHIEFPARKPGDRRIWQGLS
jgi:O-antigen ligase